MLSLNVRRAILVLGTDIRTARLRRRMVQKDLATMMGVSIGTVRRLEAGDPGISIGNFAMALLCLGCLDKITSLLADTDDEIGKFVDRQNLPQRIRKKKNPDELMFEDQDGRKIRLHRSETGAVSF